MGASMRRLMGPLWRRPGTVSAMVAVGACLSAGAAGAQPSTPVISNFKATPASVGSAGFTVVTATVSSAEKCTLSSTKAVVGLPATVSCAGGNVERGVRMPANNGRKALRYTLKLTAIGSRAKRKANAVITVSRGALPPAATAIAAGGQHSQTCALLSTGDVDCWGANYFGQLGDGSLIGSDTPVEAIGVADPTQATVGGDHVCALLSTGHVDCWGYNEYGQLGNGITTGPDKCPFAEPPAACSPEPVEVTGVTDASHVTAGGDQTCAVLSTGHVECWGLNGFGELGDGSASGPETCGAFACSAAPVEVTGITDPSQVSAGGNQTCALLSSGHIDCWGSNQFGGLGDGSAIGPEECGPYRIPCSAAPVEVTGITDATEVSGGGGQTCALLSTGHIDCWGRNGYGQLGDGSTEDSDAPVEVSGISEATQVSAGGDFTCALLSTGDVECWGDGEFGELGNGATSRSDTPVDTAGITEATQVSAGGDQACVLLPTGQLDCWGANYDGQLGNGSTEGSDVPVEVGI
jgi:alpha-tubulin suppressor-like RCC1 family protein